MRRAFSFFAVLSLLLCALLCGCEKKGLDFQNENVGKMFAEAFSKEVNEVTEEDLASVRYYSMITYSQTNIAEFVLDGYDEASDSEKESFVRTVDITDLSLEDMSDFHYLTGLEGFSAAYTGYSSYDFLSSCQKLESLSFDTSYNCTDFTFTTSLPSLKSLSMSTCTLDNDDFLSSLTSLSTLNLTNVTSNGEYIYELDFVSPLTELTELTVSGNRINDLTPLLSLSKLERLDLSYGSVSDVTPISKLESLVFVDLTQNPISDVSSLTEFDPDSFERLVLDLNSGIKDWSPLEYIWDKVQGKPTQRELAELEKQRSEEKAAQSEA